jgi:hypothetical protein
MGISRTLFGIIILVLLGQSSNSQNTFALAGVANSNDTLTDLAPDSIMQCIAAHLNPYQTTIDSFDLDRDGQPDIVFKTYGDAGLGGGAAGCTVYSAGGHAEIAVRIDTVVICCPQNIPLTVADTFNLGDTLDGNLSYASSGWIMSESWGGSTAPFFDRWTNIGPKFIGVRLFASSDTLYGWVRIEATQNAPLSLFTLTIYELGCNKNLHIGIDEHVLQNAVIFPNASGGIFRIRSSKPLPDCQYRVVDLRGYQICRGAFSGSETMVDGSQWAAGNYLLLLRSDKGQKVFRLIKE